MKSWDAFLFEYFLYIYTPSISLYSFLYELPAHLKPLSPVVDGIKAI